MRTSVSFIVIFLLCWTAVAIAAEAEALLKVEKLHCGSCLNRIHTTVAELDGTDGVNKYDFQNQQLWFTYQSDKLSAETIANTITEAGYPAKVIDDGLTK